MRTLIAEDDYASRRSMMRFCEQYGACDVTVDGMEATYAFTMALDEGVPYDLVCLDVMMPTMDGYQTLKFIRSLEAERNIPEEKQVKIIMMTALGEEKNVKKAFEMGCNAYSVKPIDTKKFEAVLKRLALI